MKRKQLLLTYISIITIVASGCKKEAIQVDQPSPTTMMADTISPQITEGLTDVSDKSGTTPNPTPNLVITPGIDNLKPTLESETASDESIEVEPTMEPNSPTIPLIEPDIITIDKIGWVSEDKTMAIIDEAGTMVSVVIGRNEVCITGILSQKTSELLIPEYIDDKTVTIIGEEAFMGSDYECIILPSDIQEIRDKAFYDCMKLKQINIPKSTTEIGELAFGNCTLLQEITVDSGNHAYSVSDGILFSENMTTLVKYPTGRDSEFYIIPDGVRNIDSGAFSMGVNLRYVALPSTITSIKDEAFSGCFNIDLYLSDNLIEIGSFAFADCHNLRNIILPETLNVIYEGAFTGCENLTYVNVKGNLSEIGYAAFSNCSSLQEINFLGRTDTIGELAFAYCTSLRHISIPDGATDILDMAFYGCSSMQSIIIPESITYIGVDVFNLTRQATIYARKNSVAHSYAVLNSLNYIELP